MAHEKPGAEPLSRAPELQALLRDLDGLRLSIATDLSLAAAALEAGSPEIAAAVVDSDRAQLQDFEQRALHHLGVEGRPDAGPATAEEPASPPVIELDVARTRRRRSVLAAATPLVASAAAVLGVLAGVVPTGSDDSSDRVGTQTAMASYQQLTRLTLQGAEAADVARAAQRLHDQLAAIVAQASEDPAAAQQALALLESEALVLDSSADRDALSGVIAEARTLVARLRAALPAVPARTPRVPVPGSAPDDVALRGGVLVPAAVPRTPSPGTEPSPQNEQPAESQPSSASPSPSPQDAPQEDGRPDEGHGAVLPAAVVPAD